MHASMQPGRTVRRRGGASRELATRSLPLRSAAWCASIEKEPWSTAPFHVLCCSREPRQGGPQFEPPSSEASTYQPRLVVPVTSADIKISTRPGRLISAPTWK